MFAVPYTAPRPPLGVALLGLLITTFSLTLRLLPYIVFCSMIVLSVWISSSPVEPEPVYYPFLDRSNHIYPVPTTNVSPIADKIRSLELNASLRILIFLLAVPVTSILENIIFRPARDLFVQTVEFWYDLRYVQAAQLTGSWPATCIPILNALRSFQFLADLIDGAAGIEKGPIVPHGTKGRKSDMLPPSSELENGECSDTPLQGLPILRRTSSSHRTVCHKHRQNLDLKHTPSPDPVDHSKEEDSYDFPHPRITFISPPRVSPSSPWVNCASQGSLPVSKNLSRIVGTIFHYPAPRKPVLRPRLNLRRALSSRSSNADFERVFNSASLSPLSLLRTPSNNASMTSCSDLKKVEQVQHTLFPENVQLPHAAQPSQPPILVHPQFFVSSLQANQPIQTHYTQLPAFFTPSYPEHHIPVYGPQLTLPALSNAPELPFACPEPASCSTTFQLHASEHMDIDGHRQLIPEPLQRSRAQGQSTFTTLESSPHVNTSSYPPHNLPAFSQSPPVVEYMSTSPNISRQEVSSLPSYEPGIKAPTSQPHVMQPVQDHIATEMFAFDVLPGTATHHLNFSCHPTPPPPPYSDSPGSTPAREVLLDVNPLWQPASSECAIAEPPKPLAPSASPSYLPKVMPSSPADLVRAIAGDGKDKDASNSEESDSDTSDSDYSESSSEEDDSDSDSDSSDDSDEEEAATIVGPSEKGIR